jgi:hypothetical protein
VPALFFSSGFHACTGGAVLLLGKMELPSGLELVKSKLYRTSLSPSSGVPSPFAFVVLEVIGSVEHRTHTVPVGSYCTGS